MLIDGEATDEVDERGHAVNGDTLLILMNSGDAGRPFHAARARWRGREHLGDHGGYARDDGCRWCGRGR